MQQLICRLILIVLSAIPISGLTEPARIHIVTENWVGYTNHDGSGYYFDILRRIFPAEDWLLEIDMVPFSRVRYLLHHHKADMALGFYPDDKANSIYSDIPIEVDTVDVAVTPELAALWQGIGSLAQKKVQALLDYRFDELIPVAMYYEESVNLLDLLNRVNQGKIDAVLDYKPAMLTKVAELNQPRQFVIIEDVFRLEVYFVFSKTDKGELLKTHFDKELTKLIASGELEQLFRHYVGENAERLSAK
ncbi:transporter substrate-binding domain-containing protein [Shewanella psychropiezotolerans]|uniref:Transporter substrate-binding domain-containing protein n=1 Tax=Shewanella psychropiezotolerans TaxID=2593655 RepID=A0ABX5WSB7_9GAMM|nr:MULTISPECIES: transporter substrate-binding domain-containing protein [Shewanella]MPY25339.1 transporter substrate-binding domain-containing protein [Shewanella sp. YLB-07]QDO82010.1 transporter substrate-binding domain-containing protein [Shewanella psychropiezotolerans]